MRKNDAIEGVPKVLGGARIVVVAHGTGTEKKDQHNV